jgi:hypothetical protein
MVRAVAFALAGMLCWDAAHAADIYACKLRSSRSNDWIGDDLIVVHDRASGKVTVADAPSQYFQGGPIAGRVATDSETQVTFAWVLRVNDGIGQAAQMLYRATYKKKTGEAFVSAQAAGYRNSFRKFGRCRLIRQ